MLLRWGLEALCSKTGSELPASWCVPKRGRHASNARLSLSPRKAAAKRRPAGEDTRFGRGGTEASRRSGGRRGPRTLRTRSALRDGPRHAGARAVALIGDVLTRVLRRVTCRRLADSVGRKGWAQRPRPTTSIGPCRAHHLQLSLWRDLCCELVTVGGQAWRWPWQRRSSWKNSPVSLKRGTPPKRS